MHFRIGLLKMIVNGGFLTALKYTKFVYDRGLYSAYNTIQRSPRLPSWFKGGPTSKERRGEVKEGKCCGTGGEEEGRKREGYGREAKGRKGKWEHPFHQFLRTPVLTGHPLLSTCVIVERRKSLTMIMPRSGHE